MIPDVLSCNDLPAEESYNNWKFQPQNCFVSVMNSRRNWQQLRLLLLQEEEEEAEDLFG